MKTHLVSLGIAQTIINRLEKFNFNKDTDGILELECNNGSFSQLLKQNGLEKYHGTDASTDNIADCKAITNQKRRFHVADPHSLEALEHKSELLVCTDAIPWINIKPGQAIAIVTSGWKDWDACCIALAPYIAEGAETIQFNGYFLTLGYRA